MLGLSKFIAELRRRRVIKSSAAYLVVAWLLIEISSVVFPALLLPDWAHRLVVILAIVAFPVVLVIAWFFDISPRGIEHTSALPEAGSGGIGDRVNRPALLPPSADSAMASICVLPFEVLSSDPEDKFLAQGVCVEVSSALSKLSAVRVVPRASAAAIGEGVDIRELGARLGVQYVLTGSLRRHAEKIRIVVELADAYTGSQLWSETYRRVLDDVMEVEEEIAGAIVGSFGGEQLREQINKANEGETRNPTAWSLVHKARSFVLNYNQATLEDAEAFARKALKLDPEYAAANATLADVLSERVTSGLSADPDKDLQEATAAIEKALAGTPDDPFVLKLAGNVWKLAGQDDRAIESLRHAVDISPFDLGAWGYLGGTLAATDDDARLQEAIAILDRILEMAPQHPGAGFWLHHKALACSCQGNYPEAVKYARQALKKQPGLAWAWYLLANALAGAGDEAAARKAIEQARVANENLSVAKFAAFVRRTSATDLAAERRLGGLVELGVIEKSVEA